jgi:hypothetical protein
MQMLDLHTATSNQHLVLSRKLLIGGIGVFMTFLVLLVVMTFPGFFLFNAIDETNPIRAMQLMFSSLAWVVHAISPSVILVGFALGKTQLLKYLPVASLLWPISIAINQITLFVMDGIWYGGYLIQYPVFIMTDILMPVFLIFIWEFLRPRKSHEETQLAENQLPSSVA